MKYLIACLALVACSKTEKETPVAAPTPPPAIAPGSAAAAAPPPADPTPVAKEAPVPTPGPGSNSGPPPNPPAPTFDFDKLSGEAKAEFMKTKVVPTMKPLFQEFDKAKYKDFGCKTCHGKNAKANHFKMPNGDIPKLDFEALKAGKQAPKVAKWMSATVKPEMAKLLQQPEMTEANPQGFGCLECHEQKK